MNSFEILLLILGMFVVTYITRRLLLRMPSHLFSNRLKKGFSYIPLGIFSALIFESLFIKNKAFHIEIELILASIICVLLMWASKNVFISFGVSLLVVIISKSILF